MAQENYQFYRYRYSMQCALTFRARTYTLVFLHTLFFHLEHASVGVPAVQLYFSMYVCMCVCVYNDDAKFVPCCLLSSFKV